MPQCQCLTYRVCVLEVGDSVLMHFEMHSGPVVCFVPTFQEWQADYLVLFITYGVLFGCSCYVHLMWLIS